MERSTLAATDDDEVELVRSRVADEFAGNALSVQDRYHGYRGEAPGQHLELSTVASVLLLGPLMLGNIDSTAAAPRDAAGREVVRCDPHNMNLCLRRGGQLASNRKRSEG